MGVILLATVGAGVTLALLSLFDMAAEPPRSSSWRALCTALFFLGAGTAVIALLSPPLGAVVGILGTLAVGAGGGRPTAAVLAPAFLAGAVLVLTILVRDDVNISYWFALVIGAPLVIALTAGLLAIAAALRVLSGRRR